MDQDFLNWQETIHMLPLSDGVCTGKGRGWWRLADLACPDKNIVWWALLSVFRAWDGHSSTPVRPPWQWLALSSSFPGPLSRWPASWKCQRWVAVLSHIIALWPLLSSVLFISRKSILPKLFGCLIFLCDICAWRRIDLPAPVYFGQSRSDVTGDATSFEVLVLAWPSFDLFNQDESVFCCNVKHTHTTHNTEE